MYTTVGAMGVPIYHNSYEYRPEMKFSTSYEPMNLKYNTITGDNISVQIFGNVPELVGKRVKYTSYGLWMNMEIDDEKYIGFYFTRIGFLSAFSYVVTKILLLLTS